MSRERVAFFSPLPPARTGTADYAAELIPELKKLVDLHVFDRVPRAFDPASFDNVVYQIGNNPFHLEIYEMALRHPGIVVLHEANLHDLIRGMTAHQPDIYWGEVYYEIFGEEWPGKWSSDARPVENQPPSFTMMRRLLDRSKACIAHSSYVENAVRMKGFRGEMARIPHGIRVRDADGAAFRVRLGIASDQPLIGMFGYIRPGKLACECLGVFRNLLDFVPDAQLLIAGSPHPEVPLAETIALMKLECKVRVVDFQSLEDLDASIAACDVVLNLRWPTFGESSGITARAFGLGRTVVLFHIGANLDLPNGVCVPVPFDRHRDRTLLETLKWLLSSRAITEEIGSSAAKWASSTCDWATVARQYADFFSPRREPDQPAASDLDDRHLRRYLSRWVQPGSDRHRYLEEHRDRLIRTLQLTPRGTSADRILEMGCYLQITPALKNLLGYGEVRGCYLGRGPNDRKWVSACDGETFDCEIDLFNCECDEFPYPEDFFATILCCELLEHLERDPMRMMSGIRRILKPGGILLLTTPNIVSLRSIQAVLTGDHPGYYSRYPDPGISPGDHGHRREYTPTEIERLLTAAGFLVEHIETGNYGRSASGASNEVVRLLESGRFPSSLRGDCIFAVGRKESLPVNPRPGWLYDSAHSG